VRDRQLLRREKRDDGAAFVGDDDLLLDAGGGIAVRRRAISFERKDHPGFDLHRIVETHHPTDDRPLMQRKAEAVAKLKPKGRQFVREAQAFRGRPDVRDDVSRDARLDQVDRIVEPFAALLVRVVLGWSRAPQVERAVIAGAIALIAMQDIEERLIAGRKMRSVKLCG
jgi:hypothetical protein